MQAEGYRSWHGWNGEDEGHSGVLFRYGNPGAGKNFSYATRAPPGGEKQESPC